MPQLIILGEFKEYLHWNQIWEMVLSFHFLHRRVKVLVLY